MNWEKLYTEYLSRCKSNPLTLEQFIKLRKKIDFNKRMEEKRNEWFGYTENN